MPIMEPILKSADCIKKLPKPVLTGDDVPFAGSLVFNAGVAKINGKYVMIYRNDYGYYEDPSLNGSTIRGVCVGLAISDNGIDNWKVREVPLIDCHPKGFKYNDGGPENLCYYDPRFTVIDGKYYLCLANDTRHGVRGCIAEIDENFEKIEIISKTTPDNRNMVLFPEKIDGYFYRLERPFPVYGRGGHDRFDIWISKSPDLKFWGESELLLAVEHVPYSNDKIGPAAPPIKTDKGWLTTFHAVDKDDTRGKNGWEAKWTKRYTAGIMLLDLKDPSKVIGMSKLPLIAPELDYETDFGYRQNVIFPGGMILEPDGEVKIYYGAGDTVECLATAHVDDLINLCTEDRDSMLTP